MVGLQWHFAQKILPATEQILKILVNLSFDIAPPAGQTFTSQVNVSTSTKQNDTKFSKDVHGPQVTNYYSFSDLVICDLGVTQTTFKTKIFLLLVCRC